jgi:hypothetical protein
MSAEEARLRRQVALLGEQSLNSTDRWRLKAIEADRMIHCGGSGLKGTDRSRPEGRMKLPPTSRISFRLMRATPLTPMKQTAHSPFLSLPSTGIKLGLVKSRRLPSSGGIAHK